MSRNGAIEKAKEHFAQLLTEQFERIEMMKSEENWVDYKSLRPVIIGICPGDGIGRIISKHARRVLEHMLRKELAAGAVEFRDIAGLTIENRAEHGKAVPDDVLGEIKQCHVILKGPTTTPQAGGKWPNLESANVALRRELDLFANVRPVKIPAEGINWCFFRENTEGAYVLGSRGIDVDDDLSVDFKIITQQGAERIIRMAFEYAKNNGLKRVTAVTKANVVKTTDGRFSRIAKEIAEEYKEFGIEQDEWYIDIMTAKLLDPARRGDFQVIVLPNLYGDILTDEAAQLQGGVGTAGSANIGRRWAMFEAIHGSAPRMVAEGRDIYADPASMIRAVAMLLRHTGFAEKAGRLDMALEICGQFEKRIIVTGRDTGATGEEFTAYVLEWMDNLDLEKKWEEFTGVF
ncbi:MAG: isocitrate/isopropylmalate dehydrogenase family protein [Candidatus Makaraimicrobium thalassicum]|nr:MAG: isocitrate/isopropylmalate dehydrogenase family protein [Candidatus Omnitrophota bacterium]